jgi:hypothetical protein
MKNKKILVIENINLMVYIRVRLFEGSDIVVLNESLLCKKLRHRKLVNYSILIEKAAKTPVDKSIYNNATSNIAEYFYNYHKKLRGFRYMMSSFEWAKKCHSTKKDIVFKHYIYLILSDKKGLIEYVLAQTNVVGSKIKAFSSTLKTFEPFMPIDNTDLLKIKRQILIRIKWERVFKKLQKFIRYAIKKITTLPNKRKVIDNGIISCCETRPLYFPQEGIEYRKIFTKDLYYKNENDYESYCHIELCEPNKDTKSGYEKRGVKYLVIPPRKYKIRVLIKALKRTLIVRGNAVKEKLLLGKVILFLTARENRYNNFFSKDKFRSKLAIVGYDSLFDPLLSVILQQIGCIVFAVQERLVLSLYRDYSYLIFDKYICEGMFTVESLKKNNLASIDEYGFSQPYRSDWIINKTLDNTIICFDYDSNVGLFKSWNPIANIINNRIFYEDVIFLARKHSSHKFIIKSKSYEWVEMTAYEDIVNKLHCLHNVSIAGLESNSSPYQLVSFAFLILGKHTSAIDEAIVAGKKCLIHDYGLNYSGYFRSKFNGYYENDMFATSLFDLSEKFDDLLKTDEINEKNNSVSMKNEIHAILEEYL